MAKHTPQKNLSQLHDNIGNNCVKMLLLHGSKYIIWLNISYSNIKFGVNLKQQYSGNVIPCNLLVPE